jgi:4-diphosphocytidyl-2-C-methyl-D-erythritol kinase
MQPEPSKILSNCPAPAKLNLFLHVTGRRDDGYHSLQTVFQLVDLSDSLDFRLLKRPDVVRANPLPGVAPEADLCVRAARALQKSSGIGLGAAITLNKRIPMGGGLGGGSSDAATTLIALNRLWSIGFNRRQLMAIGAPLGADVPFFIFGHNAFAEGIGHDLTRIETEERFFAVIHPGVSVPTAVIFGAPELTRNTLPIKISDFCAGAQAVATKRLGADFGTNDLEAVAKARFPAVGEALDWLGRFGVARMTGSGACVFAAFDTRDAALSSLQGIPEKWTGWVCASRSSHPLYDWLPGERA